MRTLRLKIADLFAFEESPPTATSDDAAGITALVQKQFGFLPQPLAVQVEGNDVVLTFQEEQGAAHSEAVRLAERASKRAAEGHYDKAISILKRALELQPALHAARRDLAMAYVEVGDVDNATNHLIEVLRLNPSDAWSWVVLANLYIQQKRDKATGEKFLRKALEISPSDAWALNSLAAITAEAGNLEEAIRLFEAAIAANPDFPNAYHGRAIALRTSGDLEKSASALEQLFSRAKHQDARSKPVFESARDLYASLQVELAERAQSDVFKIVQNFKAELESASGFPVRTQEENLEGGIGAKIQMAWKHGRDFHLLKTRADYPPPLVSHLQCHELTHLRMEIEARKAGKNQFFATSGKTNETANQSIFSDLRKLEKQGYSRDSVNRLASSMVSGLAGFLFNCPLDMIIEQHLRQTFPLLRSAQFLSVRVLALEAAKTNTSPEIRKVTPRKIMQATLALNGAYTLFLDRLFAGASDFAAVYRREDTFGLSQRLLQHWDERSSRLNPGDEYRIVDEFADILSLRGWYLWQPDPGGHEVTSEPLKEGNTNPELLKEKHPAAIFYFLDALKRYDAMLPQQVRTVAFEIAMLGQRGLDYASAEEKYELRSIPGRKFSGLHLMCLMHAGFKRVAPEHDPETDLDEPFLTALQMHQAGKDASGNK